MRGFAPLLWALPPRTHRVRRGPALTSPSGLCHVASCPRTGTRGKLCDITLQSLQIALEAVGVLEAALPEFAQGQARIVDADRQHGRNARQRSALGCFIHVIENRRFE